jgi:ribosomal protein S18 acetylase RimI-like enzyme
MDTTAFEQKLVVRPLRSTDFEAVVEIQLACFPRMSPWTRPQFEAQLATFPEGQLGVELDGALVGLGGLLDRARGGPQRLA